MPRIKKLIVEKFLTDQGVKDLKGCFMDESYMKYPVIQSNIDVYYIDDNGNENLFSGGYFNTTTALTRVQFKMANGNIDAGTICLYGIL